MTGTCRRPATQPDGSATQGPYCAPNRCYCPKPGATDRPCTCRPCVIAGGYGAGWSKTDLEADLRFRARHTREDAHVPEQPQLATAHAEVATFAGTAGTATVDAATSTVRGLVVPFGPIGRTNMGAFTFAAGSLGWAEDPSWVKLLLEHDQDRVVGHAVRLWEDEAGVWGEFRVAGPDREAVLAAVGDKLRDAFSVGTELDERTLRLLSRAQGQAVPASGRVREVSLVSVPAFEAARVGAAANVTAASWSPATERTTGMPCSTCGRNHAPGVSCAPQQPQLATATQPAQPAPSPQPAPQPAPTPQPAPAPQPIPQQPQPQQLLQAGWTPELVAAALQLQGAGQFQQPAHVPAAGGQAHVVSEGATYTFDGRGHSFVRDSFRAVADGDQDAQQRLQRFRQELNTEGATTPALMLAAVQREDMRAAGLMTAAVETRVTADEFLQPTRYSPADLVRVADVGRPLFARLRSINLTDATPFRLPVEGEFTGVGPHTEGTAHVAEGSLTAGSVTATPRAVSGAYRVTRELVDASNPAIDQVALAAMMRDYRRTSEALVLAPLAALPAPTGADLGVDTIPEFRARALAFYLRENLPADLWAAGVTAFTGYYNATDTTGRPLLAPVNPTNAPGTTNGYALSLDGQVVIPVSAPAMPATDVFGIRADSMVVGESSLLTFRFDQPEGPGIIKLALWAYQVAAITRAAGIMRLRSAAA